MSKSLVRIRIGVPDMHRNIVRAYDYLRLEHDRIRATNAKILAQGDASVERRLLGANLKSPRHLEEMLVYEQRLSAPQRRRVLDLNRYGRKLERIMDALLRL
jgi:hypothetical protein